MLLVTDKEFRVGAIVGLSDHDQPGVLLLGDRDEHVARPAGDGLSAEARAAHPRGLRGLERFAEPFLGSGRRRLVPTRRDQPGRRRARDGGGDLAGPRRGRRSVGPEWWRYLSRRLYITETPPGM